jgi:hypothetical protein
MIISDAGPFSRYVSTGFFGAKCFVALGFLVVEIILISSYFGPCRHNRGG